MSVQVDTAGARSVLLNVRRGLHDLSLVFAGPINKSVDTVFRRQFESQGAFGGSPWRPLHPVTLKLRQRPGHGRGGILRDTNRMWASLTKSGLGPDAIKVVTPHSLERGTSVKYAQWMHTGFKSKYFVVVDKHGLPVPIKRARPKTIPPRPIVPEPMPAEVVSTWEKILVNFLIGGQRAA